MKKFKKLWLTALVLTVLLGVGIARAKPLSIDGFYPWAGAHAENVGCEEFEIVAGAGPKGTTYSTDGKHKFTYLGNSAIFGAGTYSWNDSTEADITATARWKHEEERCILGICWWVEVDEFEKDTNPVHVEKPDKCFPTVPLQFENTCESAARFFVVEGRTFAQRHYWDSDAYVSEGVKFNTMSLTQTHSSLPGYVITLTDPGWPDEPYMRGHTGPMHESAWVYEPERCVEHIDIEYYKDSDCDGWEAGFIHDGVRYVLESGSWSEPYDKEQAEFDSLTSAATQELYKLYDDHVEYINHNDPNGIKDGGVVEEPPSCVEDMPYEVEPVISFNSCHGFSVLYNVYDVYGNLVVHEHSLEYREWQKPYELETYPAKDYEVELPDGRETTVHVDEVEEPDQCLEPALEVTTYLNKGCSGWQVGYEVDGSTTIVYEGTWEDEFIQETVETDPINLPNEYDDLEVSDPYNLLDGGTVVEPEHCVTEINHDYSFEVVYNGCEGWELDYSWYSVYGSIQIDGLRSGTWDDPNSLEGPIIGTATFSWPDGHVEVVEYEVNEPESCLLPVLQVEVFGENTCEGWEVGYTYSGHGFDERVVTDSGDWTKPGELEEDEFNSVVVDVPDGYRAEINDPINLTAPNMIWTVFEHDKCLVHQATTFLNEDCDGWEVGYELDGEKVVVDSGSWSDVKNLETAEFSSFDIMVETGSVEITDPQNLMDGGTAEEPERCLDVTYRTSFYPKNRCDQLSVRYQIFAHYSGNSSEMVEEGYVLKHIWEDPYVQEVFGPKSYVVEHPDGTTSTYDLEETNEPESCVEVHEIETQLLNDCDGWEVAYTFDGEKTVVASGTWDKPYELESATFEPFDIPIPEGEKANILDIKNLMSGGYGIRTRNLSGCFGTLA